MLCSSVLSPAAEVLRDNSKQDDTTKSTHKMTFSLGNKLICPPLPNRIGTTWSRSLLPAPLLLRAASCERGKQGPRVSRQRQYIPACQKFDHDPPSPAISFRFHISVLDLLCAAPILLLPPSQHVPSIRKIGGDRSVAQDSPEVGVPALEQQAGCASEQPSPTYTSGFGGERGRQSARERQRGLGG